MNKAVANNATDACSGGDSTRVTQLDLLAPTPVRLLQPRILPEMKLSKIEAPAPALDFRGETTDSPFAMRGAKLWSGNTRSLIIGMTIGALLLCFVGRVYNEHQRAIGAEPLSWKRFVQTRTHSVSASPHEIVPPAPIIIQIDERLIHVTAIALGHPRLAVINGQTVAEGDYVKVRSSNPAVIASLRVAKIGDGRIDLSDGTQTITTQLLVGSSENDKVR